MPELPEVETLVRTLRPALIGKTVLASDLRWARTLAEPEAPAFKRRILGQRVEEVSRRAKYFILQLTTDHLILHLRMSGSLLVVIGGYAAEEHDRLILTLDPEVRLIFNDPRKFGRAWLVKDPLKVLGALGPEPLSDDFTPAWLYSALHSRRRQLKPLLLDQTFLAGLGNIYTDESLHRARLHPMKTSERVTSAQADRLWRAIRETLEEGIMRNGASIDWVYHGGEFQNHFRVYGRAGEPCPVCGRKIRRMVVSQRGTHFCPQCQK